jgi:hypothetical protein
MKILEHNIIYKDKNYFAGWPFNGGMWQFNDEEIAVGFVRGKCDYESQHSTKHWIVDRDQGEHLIIRSFDGGHTWDTDNMTSIYTRPEFDNKVISAANALTIDNNGVSNVPNTVYIDYANPNNNDFCILAGFGLAPKGHDAAFVMRSLDRGYTWSKPVHPDHGGFKFLSLRPCYIIMPDKNILLFGFAGPHSSSERYSIPVVYKSIDGGASWDMISTIKPKSNPEIMSIMADPLLMNSGEIIVSVRRQGRGLKNAFTEVYISNDNGYNWEYLSQPCKIGAPSTMVQLKDNRIVCVYGMRGKRPGIRAAISEDYGRTWDDSIILRDDGANYDTGYPRTIIRKDGKLLTTYYHNTIDDSIGAKNGLGGIRYIVATIWEV